MLTEEHPQHYYVIAIAVNANEAPIEVQQVYTELALAKMTIYITHLLSGLALFVSVHVGVKILRVITPVFAITQIVAFVYTAVECTFTVFQLVDPMSRGLVIAAMCVTCGAMLLCVAIVIIYTKNVRLELYHSGFASTISSSGAEKKRLISFYKDIESPDQAVRGKARTASNLNNNNGEYSCGTNGMTQTKKIADI